MQLIDSHCHLDVAEFSTDLPDVLAAAQQAGVSAFVVPAIGFAGWAHLAELASSTPCIKPAYGLHPMFLVEHRDTWICLGPLVQFDRGSLPDWLYLWEDPLVAAKSAR